MLIPFETAQQRILDAADPILGSETVDVDAAAGRVLAEPLLSGLAVPLFDNSSMDGYAMRSVDISSTPIDLRVVGVSSAGEPFQGRIGPRECIRILTGAMLCDGADSVVPVESTDGGRLGEAGARHVRIDVAPQSGQYIRRAGSSVRPGDQVIASGTKLNAGHLGLAATVGATELTVCRMPRVAVVSTGDELVEPGKDLSPGQIYESNRWVIESLVRDFGCLTTSAHCGDDADSLRAVLLDLAEQNDVLITTGGVSMGGEYDALGVAAASLGIESWKVAIKPAKPFVFGKLGATYMVGLPGNPASAVVSFELFARPLLRRLVGITPAVPDLAIGRLGEAVGRRRDGKVHLLGVVRDADCRWRPVASIQSHLISTLSDAEALALLDDDRDVFEEGTQIRLLPLWVG